MIYDAPRHNGDRVMFDGREWKVVQVTGHPHHTVGLVATDHSGDTHPTVHMSHLTMSWCPLAHGGDGPPPEVRPALPRVHPCAHEQCHEPIDAGERYARVTQARQRVSMHLECAQIHVGRPIAEWAVR